MPTCFKCGQRYDGSGLHGCVTATKSAPVDPLKETLDRMESNLRKTTHLLELIAQTLTNRASDPATTEGDEP